jgi:hypothetical protein
LQFSATAVLSPRAYAVWFMTGKLPGMPMQTGHVCVFGSAPKLVLQRQNNLVSVCNWTWTSSPMIVSYAVLVMI